MKVWGGLLTNWARCRERTGQVRTIVAASSQKEAAKLVGLSLYEFRNYWSETGNAFETEVAKSRPGILFHASTSMGNDFEPVTPLTAPAAPSER